MHNFCGLDFGTSNSSIGFCSGHHISLTQFGNKTYTPSSIFFEFDEHDPHFGETAVAKYIDGREGRMIWSPKNALGTNLILEKTQVDDKSVSFKDIIGLIIQNLKRACEQQAQQDLTQIVVGRPVFYNDKDPKLDKEAQDAMHEILAKLGFKDIEFEYEPIAAAKYYEQSITHEEIALIVDMGGGTSDFTIARLNGSEQREKSRVLSIGGVHIAGTNFDRRLSLRALMPELGLDGRYKTLEGKWATIPPTLHRDLATWHKIGFCYNKHNTNYVKNKIYTSDEPHKFERLLQVLEQRLGHHLAIATEKVKIGLSNSEIFSLRVPELFHPIDIPIMRASFEEAIQEDSDKILSALNNTIRDANIKRTDITVVFMTGGASLVPLIRSSILSSLPAATLIDGDKFGSVATGLTLIAANKFGGACH